ncbi:UDP-N-acetylglucosamine--dolichyl-phosphate N-acetylglucosaminephosphotransferase [Candida viswanathii]|uniref:UDP-N-acetylglucosamine--dolichyl-phosphate N-acetylglucosaminephosphotransferase n=1 Tax=Candida viswanathii TaxID=5486 RepID=A0A367XPK5_9ASCO|nr:UDP-N-acetylglucosamine--dolichyl-phosphate N-acetylglucosaminephosphotransferase [Candida viswanathii]
MFWRLVKIAVVVGSIAAITPNNPLRTLLSFACIGYVITVLLIPKVGPSFIKIGLKGKDMSKPPPVSEIPETMGLVTSIAYMFLMIGLIPFIFFKYLVSFSSLANDEVMTKNYIEQYQSLTDNRLFPHNKLAEYLSALLCLQCTILLGLLDDLFDIRWRHKFFLPAVASIPLLIVYYVDFSVTSVVVPKFVTDFPGGYHLVNGINFFIKYGNHLVTTVSGLSFRTLQTDYVVPDEAPKLIDLGIFYYAYMSAVSIFSPNSINILAGVNGLEVGQSLVLAAIFLINDFCYLLSSNISQAAHDSHMFSVVFIIPFVGVSFGLLQYNWFPARVFVGDTYCYFSGMVFAIVGILGHFSKTLLIFLLPQIINFLYSVPQLFHILPCPRHRLPKFNVQDGFMYPSFATLEKKSVVAEAILKFLEFFKFIKIERDPKLKEIVRFSNMTIINLTLVWFGPLREDHLCMVILALQFVIGVSMIITRHTVGPWLFGYDNLSWGVK